MERRYGYGGVGFQTPQELRHPAVSLRVGSKVIPCAEPTELHDVTLAPFKDHDRQAFVASTIKSRSILEQAASKLSDDESQRLNGLMTRVVEGLLDDGIIRSDAVLKSSIPGKPDIHVLISGDSFKPNSLRLYGHVGEYQGVRVFYQDARGTRKDAERIEKAFKREGNYQTPQGWQRNRN